MSGYRIWPAVLVAVLGGAGAAVIAVADVPARADGGCDAGLEWAAVTALPHSSTGDDALLADYREQMQPVLAGCLDVSDLAPVDPAEVPDPRS